MLDARPFALAEDPLLRSATDRIAAQLQVASPKLCLIDDGFPRAFVVGRGPGRRHARRLDRAAAGRPPRGARCRHRPRARPRAQPRRPHADVRRPARDDAHGDEPARRLPLAGAALRARRRSPRVHARMLSPRREYAADRDAASVCDPHDSPTRSSGSTAPPSSSRSPRRPRPSRSTPSIRSSADRLSRMFRTHPPLDGAGRARLRALDAGRARRSSPAGAVELHRQAPETTPRTQKGHTLVWPLPEANSAASYSPRGSRPKYHWRRRA